MSAKVKRAVRLRDGYKCQVCGMTNDESKSKYRRALDVHRRIPGCKYSIDLCVTLCIPCHGLTRSDGILIDEPDDSVEMDSVRLRLPPIYRTQVGKLAEKSRRAPTEEVKIALEEYLAKEGLWPPVKE